MPDRLTLYMGSAPFWRQYDRYPATPRSDLLGVEDTTRTSAHPDDDGSQFFDFELWDLHTGGKGTDVTTPSSVSPEDKPAASPSVLGPGSFTTTAPNPGDDVSMVDAQPHEPPLPHVWPRVSGPQPPRDGAIQLDVSQSTEARRSFPRPASSQSTFEMPQGCNKKTRMVKNPDETSRVRDLKACSWCRMNKSGCDASPVSRWNWNDPDVLLPSRGQFVENRRVLRISLSENIGSPCLEVTVQPFALPNQRDQGVIRWGVMPDTLRSLEDEICAWIEQDILDGNKTEFEAHMDKLLHGLVAQQGQHPQMPKTLLLNLFTMRSMWKVWNCKQFFVRQELASQPVPLDLRFASIQDSLRLFAAERISELERNVLADIQKHIAKKDSTGVPLITKWLVLWQMIFIYRHSLRWLLEQQQTNAAPMPMIGMNEKRHSFRETTKQLLNAIVVIYAGHFGLFHKRTTLKHFRAAGAQAFSDDLQAAFQNAWQSLPEFYDQVLGQVSPTDELFKAYIVKKESEFLATDRTAREQEPLGERVPAFTG
ncbi:hypothetical protein MFIFM68171_00712 [Madurella fahalii]|uniref:Uncharacterized protein n=1 Tax=Madurella fahalii TaxID=1157608 RepID=A0ABQ0FYB9_9PEZI